MYPVPPELIRILETTPFVIIAVADAPEPPPPTIETRGEEVNPEPPADTVISLTEQLTTTAAVAPVHPPPLIVNTGGDAASYSLPAFVIATLVTAPKVFLRVDL